ncbi:hypothetical protein AJ78_04573 [Emergomyces pasteurianus Ep9510]|uniref:RNase III domain-containing protein n=1 Tax=Emergomyces pasteurianus Ep9510 TaxID=1447872 RepID=A0A1J9QGU7_9EURO|nr:hypothetical protein AJ78_04573 [Emergomyces pasteurianus Ep9510]
MDTKRKLEHDSSRAMTTGNSVKRHKGLRSPEPDTFSSSSGTSSERALKRTAKIQSRLEKLRKLTRKLLSHPEQVQAVHGSGQDVIVALAELGKAFSPTKSTPESLYYSQSPRNRLHLRSLQLHAQKALPPLPPVLDKQLQTAMFTHEGINNPTTVSLPERNYERMELLGDAYIEIIATRLVWDTFPRLPAGRLSQIRELLVKNETLAEYATLYGLDQKLLVPPDIRNQTKTWTKVKGDVFEAYVAAIILSNRENGVQLVEDWLTQLWIPKLEQIEKEKPVLRYKEELAKLIMDKGIKLSYVDEKKSASHPGGLQTFFIGVYLTGWGHKNKCLGSGTGLSKVIAGNEAARKALENPMTHRAAAAKQAFQAAKLEGEAAAAAPVHLGPALYHYLKPIETMRSRIARVCRSSYRSFSTSPGRSRAQLAYQTWPAQNDSTTIDERRNPIVFMHGLFGSKQNNRSISKALGNHLKTRIYALDLRNHGDSPHLPEHDYTTMADDVEEFIHNLKLAKPILIGHSMGAKTAMTVALRSPELISSLISVDNAPVSAKLGSQFSKYVKGMQEIEGANITKQSEADRILQQYEESLPIRQFLLTNLMRSKVDNTLKFRVPVQLLGESLDELAGFPFNASDNVKFEGPSLFIRGTKSRYVQKKSFPVIAHFFPNYKLVDVDAGHWVISENPEGFKNG